DFQQQASGSLHCLAGQLPVNTALVAMRSVSVQTVRTGFASNSDLIEESAFEEYVTGFAGNTAVLATHHTGDRQSTLMVSDNQSVSSQRNFLAIKQNELLALFRHAYANTTVDLCQ